MDPDIVRQQEEAEREALGLLAKKTSAPGSVGAETTRVQSPIFFNASRLEKSSGASAGGAVPPDIVATQAPAFKGTAPRFEHDEPTFISMGRFMSYGLAGGVLGGSLGIAAANYWRLPIEQTNLAIFGPAGALALFCAFASFFVAKPHEAGKR